MRMHNPPHPAWFSTHGKAGISAAMAIRMAAAPGTAPEL